MYSQDSGICTSPKSNNEQQQQHDLKKVYHIKLIVAILFFIGMLLTEWISLVAIGLAIGIGPAFPRAYETIICVHSGDARVRDAILKIISVGVIKGAGRAW
jgi:hypothetical protein